MPPTPYRIAQTSTELKKQYKKNGPLLNERQQKQLQRDSTLADRATRAREAEERRKGAMKKREEKEAKEARARKQIGIGLATQLVGYSHTQAKLKNGMEAFLGVKKRKEEEQRKKDVELTKKLEAIAEKMEKEPWDDDDEDMALDLPEELNPSFGEQWVDGDLDDDTLLTAHETVMSDPIDESSVIAQPPPAPAPALAPTAALTHPAPRPPALPTIPAPPTQVAKKDDAEFSRTHGPINKAIDAILNKLPEPLIELLSQDISTKVLEWDPPLSLLYKLNPLGLPPHRLRLKVGCVVSLLRDLNTSSPLSKSQHLQILRVENDRLECLVLDGQLEGTKAFLTRVPFAAKYKNLEKHPFQRTQFPIRIATDYTPSTLSRVTSQSGFKLPTIPAYVRSSSLHRKTTPPIEKARPLANQNPGFKMPGLPASKSASSIPEKHIPTSIATPSITQSLTDCWDDFLESGTQIARELSAETVQPLSRSSSAPVAASPSLVDCLPPLSTQDLDFSLEDLDDDLLPPIAPTKQTKPDQEPARPEPLKAQVKPAVQAPRLKPNDTPDVGRIPSGAPSTKAKPKSMYLPKKVAGKRGPPGPFAAGIDLSMLRPSQLPPSVSFGSKRKAFESLARNPPQPAKKQRVQASRPVLPVKSVAVKKSSGTLNDFVMSTQDAASFFDNDDVLSFGSPPL